MATANPDLWMLPSKRRLIRRTIAGGYNQDRDGDGTLGSAPPEPGPTYVTTNWVVVGAAQAQCDLPTEPVPGALAVGDLYLVVDVQGNPEAQDAMAGMMLTVDAVTDDIVVFGTPDSLFGIDMTDVVVTLEQV